MAKMFSQRNMRPLLGRRFMSGITPSPEGGMKLWKNISLFVVLPVVALMSTHVYLEHQKAHECGHAHRPKFVAYEYLRIRNKRFPWGDGTRTLFHNPHVNALQTGYEDEQ